MCEHGFTGAIPIGVKSHHGPVIDPFHRLEMNDTSVSALVLKMNEPVLASLSIHPRALVWSIDRRLPSSEHNLFLVRTINTFRTQRQLPPFLDATRWGEDVIVAVPFI